MAKKTRSIMCRNEKDEKQIYEYCDMYGVNDKNISVTIYDSGLFVNIFSGKKTFDNIAFKLGCLQKIEYYEF